MLIKQHFHVRTAPGANNTRIAPPKRSWMSKLSGRGGLRRDLTRRGIQVSEVPAGMPVFPAAQVPLSQGLHAATLLRGRAVGKLGKCSSVPKISQ